MIGNGEPNVMYSNPAGTSFINGNEVTEGSHRFNIDEDTGFIIAEVLISGIWQPASLITGAATLWLHFLGLASVGRFLTTKTRDGDYHFFPHTHFDGQVSTSTVKIPDMYEFVEHDIFQPDNTGNFTGKIFSFNAPVTETVLVKQMYFQTDSLAATECITVSIWSGSIEDPSKIKFNQTYPASEFPASTEITLRATGRLQFDEGQTYLVKIESDADFSLKTNAAETLPWIATDDSNFREDDMLQIRSYESRNNGIYIFVDGEDWTIQNKKIYICNTTGTQNGAFTENQALWDTIGESHITYNEVANFAALPDPAEHESEIYIVLASTGLNWNRRKGLYHSDGIEWARLSNVNYEVTDAEAFFRDDVDTSKIAKFELSEISTGTTRTYTFPDVSGRLLVDGMTDDVALGGNLTLSAGSINAYGVGGVTTNFVGGLDAGSLLLTGFANTLLGYGTGNHLVEEDQNTFIGFKAGHNTFDLNDAVALGSFAMDNADGAYRTIALGAYAGENATGADCVYIGYEAGTLNSTDDKLFIGNTLGTLIEGDFANEWVTVHGNLNVDRTGAEDLGNRQTYLTMTGNSWGFVDAAIVLKSESPGVGVRGTGIFMHDQAGETEWFIGRPYWWSDRFAIHRLANQPTHSTKPASPIHPQDGVQELFVIMPNGRVGILTDNPEEELTVTGDIGIRPTSGEATLRFWSGDSWVRNYTLYSDAGGNFVLKDSVAGVNRLLVNSEGTIWMGGDLQIAKDDLGVPGDGPVLTIENLSEDDRYARRAGLELTVLDEDNNPSTASIEVQGGVLNISSGSVSASEINLESKTLIKFQNLINDTTMEIDVDSNIVTMNATIHLNGITTIGGAEKHKMRLDTSSTDALDITDVRIIDLDASEGDIVIGGFTGGVHGQRITLCKYIQVGNVTIEHYESTGTQKIICPGAVDAVWATGTTGGMELVCIGIPGSEIWHVVSTT